MQTMSEFYDWTYLDKRLECTINDIEKTKGGNAIYNEGNFLLKQGGDVLVSLDNQEVISELSDLTKATITAIVHSLLSYMKPVQIRTFSEMWNNIDSSAVFVSQQDGNFIAYHFENSRDNILWLNISSKGFFKKIARNLNNFSHDELVNLLDVILPFYSDRASWYERYIDPLSNEDKDSFETPFKILTDELANTLNQEYDTFDYDNYVKNVDDFGKLIMAVYPSDKLSQLKKLLINPQSNTNDEKLRSTLMALARYAILGVRYLDEHKE